jgi:hypothetical protein
MLPDARRSSPIGEKEPLEITVEAPDRKYDNADDPRTSPWQGMSGAAVFSRNRIIGVIAKHHRSDGLGRLTASRIDRWHFHIGTSKLEQICMRLGMRSGPTGLVDVIEPSAEALMRAAYAAHIRDIAPVNLIDRSQEIAELIKFCAGTEAYGWWQGPPWVGKTALAAWFALHPPIGVRIASFFVTGRLSGQADSVAFTEAMIDQLAVIAGHPVPVMSSLSAQDGLRRHLIEETAKQLRERGERLVLVIDGLDEDTGAHPGSGRPSIASLLPPRPSDEVRILVTSRQHPPLPGDVASDHPLRKCRQRRLEKIPSAVDVEMEARYELRQRLHAVGDHREIIALIAAAGGGLTAGELAELTGRLQLEIEDKLGSAFGRSLNSRQRSESKDRVYLFAHETLRAAVDQILGADLGIYRARIHAWADNYHNQGWPTATPRYLFQPYGRLLAETGDIERFAAIASDAARHDQMLLYTNANAAALTEIAAAQDLLLAEVIPDLTSLVLLAAERERLTYSGDASRASLHSAWIRLRQMWHELDLTDGIVEFPSSAKSIARLNKILGRTDKPQAARLADEAEQAMRGIPDPGDRARALVGVIRSLGRGQSGRASHLADDAEHAAQAIADPFMRDRALADIAQALAAAGLWDRAEHAAQAIASLFMRDRALADVAQALAVAGLWDQAEHAAHDISDPGDRARALAGVVGRMGSSYPDDAARVADDAEYAVSDITDPADEAWAIAEIARGLGCGHPDRTARLADAATYAARNIMDRGTRDGVYADIALALAAAGHADRAIEAVRFISTNKWAMREQICVDIAKELAAAGRAEDAIRVVIRYVYFGEREVPDWVYADIALASAAAGYADGATNAASYISNALDRDCVYADIARQLANACLWDGAGRAARKIAGTGRRVQALNAIAMDLLQSAPPGIELGREERLHLHRLLGSVLSDEHWEQSLAIIGQVCPEAIMALHNRMIANLIADEACLE